LLIPFFRSIALNWDAHANDEWIHTGDSVKDDSGIARYSFKVAPSGDQKRYTLRFTTEKEAHLKYEFKDSDGNKHSQKTTGPGDYVLDPFEADTEQIILNVTWHTHQ
jgi:hypothetical protein